jgi:DNA-binding Xre family transcriptional regulator
MLVFNLNPIFTARGIERPYSMLIKAGFSKNLAHKFLNDKLNTMRLSQLNKICTMLHCTPNDIVIWSPDENEVISKTHPLRTLKKQDLELNWQETIKNVPLKQLKQIASIINNQKTPKALKTVKKPIPNKQKVKSSAKVR